MIVKYSFYYFSNESSKYDNILKDIILTDTLSS